MIFGVPTNPGVILTEIEAKIVEDEIVAEEYVFPTLATDDDIATQGPGPDFFITIRLGKQAKIDRIYTGAGRQHNCYRGSLSVDLWVRLESDQAIRAGDYLRNETEGLFARWGSVLNSLDYFIPLDTPGKSILLEPMRNVDFDLLPKRLAGGWGKFASAWEIAWVYDV